MRRIVGHQVPPEEQLKVVLVMLETVLDVSSKRSQWHDYHGLWKSVAQSAQPVMGSITLSELVVDMFARLECEGVDAELISRWHHRLAAASDYYARWNQFDYEARRDELRGKEITRKRTPVSPVLSTVLPLLSTVSFREFLWGVSRTGFEMNNLAVTALAELCAVSRCAQEIEVNHQRFSVDKKFTVANTAGQTELGFAQQELARLVRENRLLPVEALLIAVEAGRDHATLLGFGGVEPLSSELPTVSGQVIERVQDMPLPDVGGFWHDTGDGIGQWVDSSLHGVCPAGWSDELRVEALRVFSWFVFDDQMWNVNIPELMALLSSDEYWTGLPMSVVHSLVAEPQEVGRLYRDQLRVLREQCRSVEEWHLFSFPVHREELSFLPPLRGGDVTPAVF